MIYTYRKQLLIIIFVLLLAIGGFIAYRISHAKDTSSQTPTLIKPIASTPLNEASIDEINANMTKLLTMKYGKAIYDAQIRDGSYKRTSTSSHTVTTRVLIDVPEKKETYLYTSTGTNSTPNITAQIHCATEADQMTHPSICKEMGNE